MAPSPASAADTKELVALNAKLPSGVTLSSANTSQLVAAVKAAILDAANARLSFAGIIGEALKYAGSSAVDPGTALGQLVQTDSAVLAKIGGTTKLQKFAADASVRAASGTGANPTLVPEFATEFAATNAEAIAIAGLATKSKTAVGAIVAGRTLDADIDTDAERLALAVAALTDRKTGGSSQDIARFVAASVTSSPAFATGILNTLGTNGKPVFISKITTIAPGVVAGDPLNADSILEALFNNNGGATLSGTKLTGDAVALATIKNASKLASSISLVADTEQYSFISTSFGSRIASGLIKSSQVATLAKGIVTSMVKKPLPISTTDRNAAFNRADEAGEIAAYLLNSLTGNSTASATDGLTIFKTDTTANRKAAVAMVTSIMKTVVGAYNISKSTTFTPTVVAADVAGSVAQTLFSLNAAGAINSGIFQAIKDSFTLKTATSINKTVATAVLDALTKGVTNSAGTRYEDGTIAANQLGPVNPGTGNVVDAETDVRGS